MTAVINIAEGRPGASPDDWQHFDLVLGLTEDLLPVVSNPKATISPNSAMQALGKTPSTYNNSRHAVGFAQWTQHKTTPEEITRWSREKDYGICIQTRRIRAIDIDVTDPAAAQRISEVVATHCALPARIRDNSSKLLLAFEYTGELTKRKIKVEHGIIEMLATGQQFIAQGLHPSGARYEWAGGLPDGIPSLTLAQVNALWSALAEEFGIEASAESSSSVKAQKLSDVITSDPVAQHLLDKSMVLRSERDGRLHITCPFEDEHSGDSGDTATTYWPAHTGGYINGHFHCLHAHCEHRQDQEFLDAIEYADASLLGEFESIGETGPLPPSSEGPAPIRDEAPAVAPKASRFRVLGEAEFDRMPSVQWIVKGVLPLAELGVMFGATGSGKSFFVLDLAAAVALGQEWCGHRVKQGRVVYVAAEGATGFRKRLRAYKQHHGIDSLPLGVIEAAPNLRERPDALEVATQIQLAGGADLVIFDTLAQVMPGANENSGEDVGRVLEHCKGIRRATGAMVLVIHHTGKDQDRGARGWSGLKAAADVEIEIIRSEHARSATVTKMKDGEDGAEFGFTLETIVMGLDEDGDEISSCAVVHNTKGAVARGKRGLKGAVEKLIHQQLMDLMGPGGEVDVTELMDAVKNQMPFDPTEGKRDQRGFRIHRAMESLQAAGRVVVNKMKVSLP